MALYHRKTKISMRSNEREKTCSAAPLSLAINVIHYLVNKLTWFERL